MLERIGQRQPLVRVLRGGEACMCEATAAHHMHVHVMCVRRMHCGMHCAVVLWDALYLECTSPLARPETTRATEACVVVIVE